MYYNLKVLMGNNLKPVTINCVTERNTKLRYFVGEAAKIVQPRNDKTDRLSERLSDRLSDRLSLFV